MHSQVHLKITEYVEILSSKKLNCHGYSNNFYVQISSGYPTIIFTHPQPDNLYIK